MERQLHENENFHKNTIEWKGEGRRRAMLEYREEVRGERRASTQTNNITIADNKTEDK